MKRLLIGIAGAVLMGLALTNAQAADRKETRYIQFAFDRSEILPAAQPILHEVAGLLRSNPYHELFLVGHTCDIGTEEYNEGLARRRADSALAYLVKVEGITRSWIRDSSKGENEPRFPNTDEHNRSLNRRVELTLNVPITTAAVAPAPERPITSAAAVAPEPDRAVMAATAVAPERTNSSVALLIDRSNSMCMVDMRDAARDLMALANPADRFLMASFDRKTKDLGVVNRDRALLLTEVEDQSRESGTSLYDAIAEVSSGPLAARPAPRYLIVFSDGVNEAPLFPDNSGSGKTLDQAVNAANAHGVKLITIELGPTTAEGRQALQDLARRTGGRYAVWNHEGGAAQFNDIDRMIRTGA